MSVFDGKRLPISTFKLDSERMRRGWYSDKYFYNIVAVLAELARQGYRFGGTCPRWNLHAAFQAAGQVVTQLIETPDGQRFFTVARTIERPIKTELGGGLLAIGLGCSLEHAHRLHCAEGYDLDKAPVTPIGPACAICPRIDCGYRATPPAGRMLTVDTNRKTISPYPFVTG